MNAETSRAEALHVWPHNDSFEWIVRSVLLLVQGKPIIDALLRSRILASCSWIPRFLSAASSASSKQIRNSLILISLHLSSIEYCGMIFVSSHELHQYIHKRLLPLSLSLFKEWWTISIWYADGPDLGRQVISCVLLGGYAVSSYQT